MENELKSNITNIKTLENQIKYGKVTLVGFGPGDPDLLTIAGEKALSKADVIFLQKFP